VLDSCNVMMLHLHNLNKGNMTFPATFKHLCIYYTKQRDCGSNKYNYVIDLHATLTSISLQKCAMTSWRMAIPPSHCHTLRTSMKVGTVIHDLIIHARNYILTMRKYKRVDARHDNNICVVTFTHIHVRS